MRTIMSTFHRNLSGLKYYRQQGWCKLFYSNFEGYVQLRECIYIGVRKQCHGIARVMLGPLCTHNMRSSFDLPMQDFFTQNKR